MDISVRKDTVLSENRSWLGSAHGTEATRTVTLDTGKFTGNKISNGSILSGLVLGRITATGLYGPYDNAATDGREVAAGFLFNTIPVPAGTTKVGAPLMEHGVVIEAELPAGHGLDAAAKTDMAGRIITR